MSSHNEPVTTAHPHPEFHVQLFGSVRLLVPGHGEVSLQPLAQRLLAELALRVNTSVRRDGLVEWLWDEDERDVPQDPRQNLRVQLSNLRVAIERKLRVIARKSNSTELPVEPFATAVVNTLLCVNSKDGTIRLALPRTAVDALQFQDLVAQAQQSHDQRPLDAAIQLCGERRLLADYQDRRARQLREELYNPFRAVLKRQAEAAMERGEFARAERYWRSLQIVSTTLDEGILRQLLRTLAALARYTDAEEEYLNWKRQVRKEEDRDLEPQTYEVLRGLTAVGLELQKRVQETTAPFPNPVATPRVVQSESANEEAEEPIRSLPAAGDEISSTIRPNSNIPAPVGHLIGRGQEIVELERLLSSKQLITLTGPGGAGKTVLALEAAAGLQETYNGCAWLVELAPLQDPELVPRTVARTLGVREERSTPLVQGIVKFLAARKSLLVLDNCEHLLTGCRSLADAIIRSCPETRILATSRERLGHPGEEWFPVRCLHVPSADRTVSPDELSEFEAAQLFCARARSNAPSFLVDSRSAPVIAEICRRLDGIPLALELAAMMTEVLTVEQLRDRLGQPFELLSSETRVGLRQTTLYDCVDASFRLLSPAQQQLFIRLSVFAGGWDLEAAEAVCAGGDLAPVEIASLLAVLVRRSLVICEVVKGERRFRMLETLRQFAAMKLQSSPDRLALAHKHLHYFASYVTRLEPGLTSVRQLQTTEALEKERDNIRVALSTPSVLDPDLHQVDASLEAGEMRLSLAANLWRFWYGRGYIVEGREHLERLLKGTSSKSIGAAKAYYAAGIMASSQADYAAARSFYRRSLALYQALNDLLGYASVLNGMGVASAEEGDHLTARPLYEESLAIDRKANDRRGIATCLHNLGLNSLYLQEYEGARRCFEESLVLYGEVGDQSAYANSLNNIGWLEDHLGNHIAGQSMARQALTLCYQTGNPRVVVTSLEQIASSFCNEQRNRLQLEEGTDFSKSTRQQPHNEDPVSICLLAIQLFGAADSVRETIGFPLSPNRKQAYQPSQEWARAHVLGDVAFTRAWNEGRTMSLKQAVETALRSIPSLAVPSGDELTAGS